MHRIRSFTFVVLAAFPLVTVHAQHPAMPPGMAHEEHLAQMKKEAELKARGGKAMGFDQDRAAHHFRLTKDGGAIEVGVKDSTDATERDAIRAHLQTIARDFAEGRFDAPFATHGELPPGADAMARLRSHIAYRYEETAAGGAVHIVTSDAAALDAVHEFLRYQIREHGTGDALEVQVDAGRGLR